MNHSKEKLWAALVGAIILATTWIGLLAPLLYDHSPNMGFAIKLILVTIGSLFAFGSIFFGHMAAGDLMPLYAPARAWIYLISIFLVGIIILDFSAWIELGFPNRLQEVRYTVDLPITESIAIAGFVLMFAIPLYIRLRKRRK